MWRDSRPSDFTLTSKGNRCFHRKMIQVLPTRHRVSRVRRDADRTHGRLATKRRGRESRLSLAGEVCALSGGFATPVVV
jgi:hypothetical protein